MSYGLRHSLLSPTSIGGGFTRDFGNEVKAKILTGYLSSIIDVEIKHFDDFNDHKTVLKDIESKVTFAINMLKTIQN